MKLKMTMQEVLDAIATAGPEAGGEWTPIAIAEHMAAAVEHEMQEELARQRAFQQALDAIDCQFVPSGLAPVDPEATKDWQAVKRAVYAGFVRERIEGNQRIITGIGAALVGLASVPMTGGISAPALVPIFLPIATQIAAALNDGNA